MHIPSQQQWQLVIDKFKSVLPMAPTENEFNISETETCGTVHCVAGWYEVATALIEKREVRWEWVSGKHQLGIDLGFADGDYFKLWALGNKELWGNDSGYGMFLTEFAYNSGIPNAFATTLADVINHFEYVKKQCYAYANKEAVANGN